MLFSVLVLVLVGCSGERPTPPGATSDPVTGPVPELLDASLILYSAEAPIHDLAQTITMVGLPGVLQEGGGVYITNASNQATGATARGGAGDFVGLVRAQQGDEVGVVQLVGERSWQNTVVLDLLSEQGVFPAEGLWSPLAEGESALVGEAVEPSLFPAVVFNRDSGEVLLVEGLSDEVVLSAEPGQSLCAFSLAGGGAAGLMVCQVMP